MGYRMKLVLKCTYFGLFCRNRGSTENEIIVECFQKGRSEARSSWIGKTYIGRRTGFQIEKTFAQTWRCNELGMFPVQKMVLSSSSSTLIRPGDEFD